MSDQYMRDVLRLAIGQICQTIGYNGTQVAPLDLLQDVLHKFLQEFCRDLRRQVEHYNRSDPNLNDMHLTLRSLNVNISELLDYVNNVEPVPFLYDLPKFPAAKHCNLNFLKPGSKEVLSRPVHIYEHLPPIEPPEIPESQIQPYDKKFLSNEHDSEQAVASSLDLDMNGEIVVHADKSAKTAAVQAIQEGQSKATLNSLQPYLKASSVHTHFLDDGGSTREISSVVMTTGGFISPAMEGKLPSTIIPEIIEKLEGLDAPPSAVPKPSIPPPQKPSVLNAAATGADTITKKGNVVSTEASKEKENTPKVSDKSAKIEKRNEVKSASIGATNKGGQFNQAGSTASQGPNMVSKILKKAKKKPAMMFSLPAKQSNSTDATAMGSNDLTDLTNKAQRKHLKMLQKLSKSRKYLSTDINPSVVEDMPPGPQRQQLEKLIKKQNKQKQKILKQQLALANKNRAVPSNMDNKNIMYNEKLPGNEGICSAEQKQTPNKSDDRTVIGMGANTVQASNGSSMNPQYFAVKDELVAPPSDPGYRALSNSDALMMENMPPPPQIKLPSEPDRSKLNVLKKISKQKLPDAVPSNGGFKDNLNSVFACNDNQVINLPSGTTITPAPPTDNTALYGSHEIRPSGVENFVQAQTTVGSGHIFESNGIVNNINLSDRPKKRGRKPGSKNHPKIPGANLNVPIKMTKKMKMENKKLKLNMSAPPLLPNAEPLSAEPLNLTYANQMDSMAMGNPMPYPPAMANPINIKDEFPVNAVKARKEKKKNKDKNAIITPGISDHNAATLATKEEVNSINKKLSRIDTVFKAAPGNNLSVSNEFPNTMGEVDVVPHSKLFPPIKSTTKQKRAPIMPTANLTSFVPTSGFPIPMMPLYPFVPRPGLIPAPGIFPNPMLTQFASNSKNILMPNCMPFPNLNHGPQGKFQRDPVNENLEELNLQSVGVNYCNVPPLVPEPNKFGNVLAEKQQPDSAKSTKMQFPPHSNQNEGLSKKSIKPHCSDYETGGNLVGGNTIGDGFYGSSFGDMAPLKYKPSQEPNMKNMFSQGRANELIPPISLNLGDPIEVSDDSLESMPIAAPSENAASISIKSETVMKSTILSTGGLKMNTSTHSVCSDVYLQGTESKKMKKMLKSSIRTTASIDVFGNDNNGVGKLAGGADLIPLSGTGVSYSSKSIPPTSLTASVPVPFPLISAKDVANEITITPNALGEMEKLHKDKDHKKMKKLKEGKIKKKKDKKDKLKNKERLENSGDDKNRKGADLDKHRDKDLLKKLKKEKKKEKQRMAMVGGIHDLTTLPPTQASFATGTVLEKGIPSNSLQIPTSCPIDSSVPKLTLKLGTCQSPITTNPVDDTTSKMGKNPAVNLPTDREKKESSPELAKISPLVTRPPKQKPNTSDSNVQELDIGVAKLIANPSTTTTAFGTTGSANAIMNSASFIPPPSPWLAGGTLAASCVLLPQQLMQSSKRPHQPQAAAVAPANAADQSVPPTAIPRKSPVTVHEVSRPSSYVDAEGNRVWICPACGKVDDGSAMIGCDGCDAWYHWTCVGITVAPKDNEDWFCRVCFTRKKGAHGTDKKKKRNKKK